MDQDAGKARTEALLKDLWRRKLPMVRDHVGVLEQASQTLSCATLTTPLRNEAAMSAHKLAGSLGMFGYPEGTRCARELEHLLDGTAAPPAQAFAQLVQQLRETLPL